MLGVSHLNTETQRAYGLVESALWATDDNTPGGDDLDAYQDVWWLLNRDPTKMSTFIDWLNDSTGMTLAKDGDYQCMSVQDFATLVRDHLLAHPGQETHLAPLPAEQFAAVISMGMRGELPVKLSSQVDELMAGISLGTPEGLACPPAV